MFGVCLLTVVYFSIEGNVYTLYSFSMVVCVNGQLFPLAIVLANLKGLPCLRL